MLILALLLRAFQPPKPARFQGLRHGLSPRAENKNRCILLCSVGSTLRNPVLWLRCSKRYEQHG